MVKNLVKNKKKAFTLVEVIIVLAIIAIIAAIAIPNLTKVRTDSKVKADTQSAESIKNTTIMLLTDNTLAVGNSGFSFQFSFGQAVGTEPNQTPLETPGASGYTGKISDILAGPVATITEVSDGPDKIIRSGLSQPINSPKNTTGDNTSGGYMPDSSISKGEEAVLGYFRDINAPQIDGAVNYIVTVNNLGKVSVRVVNSSNQILLTVE